MQGAMTQGDLSSWIVAGSYKSIGSSHHAYELGLSYSTQQYDGGNAAALAAIRDNARNVGAVYGFDEWTLSPRLVLGYGTGFARYDYLPGSGLWSPRFTVTLPLNGMRIKALASQRAVVPGAEEFAPSVTGLWLPPERTFSSLAADGVFRPEQTRHLQVSLERDLDAGVTVAVRGFTQRINDQLVEVFGVDMPGRPQTPLGHYFVGTAGDIERPRLGRRHGAGSARLRARHHRIHRHDCLLAAFVERRIRGCPHGLRPASMGASENVYDLQTSVEATIPQTATRIYAKYRVNIGVLERRCRSAGPIVLEQPLQRSRESVAAVPALLQRRLGDARRHPQHVPRGRRGSVDLRRGARRARPQADRGRPARQVLASPRLITRPTR